MHGFASKAAWRFPPMIFTNIVLIPQPGQSILPPVISLTGPGMFRLVSLSHIKYAVPKTRNINSLFSTIFLSLAIFF